MVKVVQKFNVTNSTDNCCVSLKTYTHNMVAHNTVTHNMMTHNTVTHNMVFQLFQIANTECLVLVVSPCATAGEDVTPSRGDVPVDVMIIELEMTASKVRCYVR